MTTTNEQSTVLVVRVWTEYGDFPLRARLMWLDADGVSQSLPVAGSAEVLAGAVERIIQDVVRPM